MARFVGRWAGRRAQLGTLVATVLALLALGAAPAWAAPGAPQLSVSALTASKASLLATGFAPQATVEFTVAVGGCVGHASVVASTATLLAEFVTAPPCTGVATATATAGAQTATTSFVFDGPGGTAAAPTAPAAPAVPTVPGPNGAVGDAQASASTAPAPTPSGGTSSTGVPADGSATSATVPTPGQAGTDQPGRRAIASSCTVKVNGGQVPAVKAGDTVCFSGALAGRLDIRQGGTATAPITYSGMGNATVPGITARGDNIVLEGFVSKGANDNGVYVSGNNITVTDNDISQVSITNDDVDAIRFFGNGITIAHNDAHDIWANPQAGGAPHTDCMQTYAHSEPASSNIRIEANRCASPQFHQCIMAEGPHDFADGASGIGNSTNWLVANNYFECHAAAQTVALQDIHNVTFSANDFAGSGAKAIALQKDATGATVTPDNIKGPGYGELVGIDDASARQGFRGPTG